MPKGGLSYKSYTACVRDAAANGVSAKSCSALASGSGMPNSSGNNMPQPQARSIKGYSGNTVTPQPGPKRMGGNQPMSGNSGMNPGGSVRPNSRSIPKGYGRQNVTPQPGPRRPQGNQPMSGQMSMDPGAVIPGQGPRPRPIPKRRRPNPVPRPFNRNTY